MMVSSWKLSSYSGLHHVGYPELPASQFPRQNKIKFGRNKSAQFSIDKVTARGIWNVNKQFDDRNRVSAVGSSHHQLSFEDELQKVPWWLTLIKEVIWGLRSLFEFLVQQPGQLKHIEWQDFNSTLKTATLTLVLVAVFIVALSSVDSALYYLLAVYMRRTP